MSKNLSLLSGWVIFMPTWAKESKLKSFFIAVKVVRENRMFRKLVMETATPIFDQLEREYKMPELQEKVADLLVKEYEFLPEEAQEKVDESVSDEPAMWNVNAEATEIAKYLASPESDE